ncbi:sensor histidine kinase [Neobacillus cucumis]|uniref:sensor histidine kinase n=1 Tax=Neobacillus cucumis TaxID=1740721 RepID=UPI0019653674|nr:sensor histidine kinase [Neobacillus cucumis]MBM7653232.1 two-component system sensor histidine kinase LytS [Neobacillus cucumis]
MLALLPLMLERVGILIIVAFILSRMKSFRQVIHYERGMTAKVTIIAIFGAFGIISNYTGVEIGHGMVTSQDWLTDVNTTGAIANTRIMGVVIGGLLGGPMIGIGVGLIAGLHRLSLGGFTAVACAVSTIFAGVVTGFLSKRFKIQESGSTSKAVIMGILMECLQMGIILLLAKPYDEALNLVKLIAFPMIAINGFGTFLFLLIIQDIFREQERTRALQTHKALYIANQTLPFFRQGLNKDSCTKAAEIILKWTGADAIAITNQRQVLAHVGAASEHHRPSGMMATELTKKVLDQGRIIMAKTAKEIQCFNPNCPLEAAIVLPLKVYEKTVGTLKLYFTTSSKLDRVEQELAEGLGKLFSGQLEMAELERQRRLLKDAEIKALQAQVHPHFLFNAINTISSLVRKDADQARMLLIQLSVFFRSNLQGARQMLIPLEKELEHVEAYLSIEQARFPDRYRVELMIDPSLEEVLIPPFTLQPLVENAIRYAFSKTKTGTVKVRAFQEEGRMVLLTEDDGKGIPNEKLDVLGNQTVDSAEGTGSALWNIKKRIEEIYGPNASFEIDSFIDKGTKVVIKLPLTRQKWGEESVKSIYRG